MLVMEDALVYELRSLAQNAYPRECCGVLLGQRIAGTRRAEDIFPVENTAADPETSFRLSDQAVLEAEAAALERGLEIVGFYHSHPDWEAAPSETDRRYAIPAYSYPILSVWSGEAGALRSFVKTADSLVREEINCEKGGN
jgi:proteasome lid subunit RPN8/RPN11